MGSKTTALRESKTKVTNEFVGQKITSIDTKKCVIHLENGAHIDYHPYETYWTDSRGVECII